MNSEKLSTECYVAIWMITYNHEAFIAEAIESIMMQKTEYPYKLFIGEDCSTDGTREICIKYRDMYPGQIELILNTTNLGMHKNSINIFYSCINSGAKYISICEGDDYWIDPLKIQKQVDFLEKNPTYSFVGTNCFFINQTEGYKKFYIAHNAVPNQIDITTEDIIGHYNSLGFTCTLMIRAFQNFTFPELFFESSDGDRRIKLLWSLKGNGCFVNQVSAVYRRHFNSASNFIKNDQEIIRGLENSIWKTVEWNKYLGNKYNRAVANVMHNRGVKLFRVYFKSGQLKNAILATEYVDLKKCSFKMKLAVRILGLLRPFLNHINPLYENHRGL